MGLNEKFFKSADEDGPFFNTVTYTGNNSSKSITGLGFQPDLVWVKNRTNANSHNLIDSLRGAGKTIFSNVTNAESTRSSVTSFDSDGFSLGNYVGVNGNYNYVAWCFKAGGAAVTNTDGSITSQVSANVANGFSIVKYSGGNSSGTTVGHGLSSAPELIITKNVSKASSWPVFVSGGITMGASTFTLMSSSQYLALNDTYSFLSYGFDSQLGGTSNSGNSGQTIISYCFASVAGVSKVGSYTGTGASGNKIVTGFEPAFVIIKLYSASNPSGHWIIFDNVRDSEPPMLRANTSDGEFTGDRIDFNSDGFTLKDSDAGRNYSGYQYIYYAVA